MKTKVLLLALLSGFVFSVAAQEYQPQVGFTKDGMRYGSQDCYVDIYGYSVDDF